MTGQQPIIIHTQSVHISATVGAADGDAARIRGAVVRPGALVQYPEGASHG